MKHVNSIITTILKTILETVIKNNLGIAAKVINFDEKLVTVEIDGRHAVLSIDDIFKKSKS